MNRKSRAATIAVATTLAFAGPAFANVDTTWLGGTGSWNDPAKWSNGVPNGSSFHAVILDGLVTASTDVSLDSLTLGSGASITSGTKWTIFGTTQIDGTWQINGHPVASQAGRLTLGVDAVLAGSGTVSLGSGGYSAPLLASGGSLTIASGLTVRFGGGSGSLGATNQPLVNHGHIIFGTGIAADIPCLAGSPIVNDGVIDGSISAMAGDFNAGDLAGVTGDRVIHGTLHNTGHVLNITSATHWQLGGGTISGGTIQTAAGQNLYMNYFYNGGTIDHCYLDGAVVADGSTSLKFVDGDIAGVSDINMTRGYETPTRIQSANSSDVVIGSGITIHGGSGNFSTFTFGFNDGIDATFHDIHNHGIIRSENARQGMSTGEFSLLAGTLFNDGRLATLSKSFLYANHDVTFEPGGILDVQMSTSSGLGMLRLAGTLDLNTVNDSLALSTSAGIVNGTYYRIVLAGNPILGTFDSVTPGFELDYRGNEIWARFVPEPSAVMIALSLASMGLTRRRHLRS